MEMESILGPTAAGTRGSSRMTISTARESGSGEEDTREKATLLKVNKLSIKSL